jgi:hypothetical protein
VLQAEMSKTKATFLVPLSVISRSQPDGRHVYLALGLIGIGLTIGFLRWSPKN